MRRGAFLTASAVVAALGASACAKSAADELELVERSSEFNYSQLRQLTAKTADVRQVWDVGSNPPEALSGIKNAMNGYQFGFGIRPERISVVACLHNAGNIAAYDDAMWQKYNFGNVFGLKDSSGNALTSNVFAHARVTANTNADPNDPGGMYQDPTVETLQRRGVRFLVCHTGAAEHARILSQSGGQSGATPQSVLKDLLDHLIPGVIVVPSGVATLGLMQYRFHYAYTSGAS